MRRFCLFVAMLVACGTSQARGPDLTPGPPGWGGWDAPDQGYHGGGDKVPYIPHEPDLMPRPPVIQGAQIVNGHLRFTFGGGGPNCLRYIIHWFRPGLQEVNDMRWASPGVNMEEYIIPENPVGETAYYFTVQAEGKNKIQKDDYGAYREPLTAIVGTLFRTAPDPVTLGRVPTPHGDSRSVCDMARDARARNSPAAASLEAQCRASQ